MYKNDRFFDLSFLCGTADGIRTHDLQSRSLALYPAELQPHFSKWYYSKAGLKSKGKLLKHTAERPKPLCRFIMICYPRERIV